MIPLTPLPLTAEDWLVCELARIRAILKPDPRTGECPPHRVWWAVLKSTAGVHVELVQPADERCRRVHTTFSGVEQTLQSAMGYVRRLVAMRNLAHEAALQLLRSDPTTWPQHTFPGLYGGDCKRAMFYVLSYLQRGRCAICGVVQDPFVENLFLDHDKNTELVRGVLCDRCNSTEGKSHTRSEPRYAAYREHPPAEWLRWSYPSNGNSVIPSNSDSTWSWWPTRDTAAPLADGT
jgi:Recombination endonuclease VII